MLLCYQTLWLTVKYRYLSNMYTYDYTTKHSFKTTIKFADDTTIFCTITNKGRPYREEVKLMHQEQPLPQCQQIQENQGADC